MRRETRNKMKDLRNNLGIYFTASSWDVIRPIIGDAHYVLNISLGIHLEFHFEASLWNNILLTSDPYNSSGAASMAA